MKIRVVVAIEIVKVVMMFKIRTADSQLLFGDRGPGGGGGRAAGAAAAAGGSVLLSSQR